MLANLVGAAAALCSMASFAPQLVKIWRERDARAVSLRMYVVTVAGFALWTAYGVMIGRWPLVAANSVCLAMAGAVLALKLRTDR
jgi:MtN3 and saliva related transmembrane protein